MTTLREIEAAADALPPEQKQELLLFLAARLRAQPGPMPTPRTFAAGHVQDWIKADEADMQRLRNDARA